MENNTPKNDNEDSISNAKNIVKDVRIDTIEGDNIVGDGNNSNNTTIINPSNSQENLTKKQRKELRERKTQAIYSKKFMKKELVRR